MINYNKSGLLNLHIGNLEASESRFLQAQHWLNFSTKSSYLLLKSMTFNNLANLYMKKQDLEKSLSCLSQVLTSDFSGPKTNLAITYINLSVLESQMNSHEKALGQILTAISIFKESPHISQNCLMALIIALHNSSLEYEFLGKNTEAQKAMREAWELSLEHLGPDHVMTHSVFQELNELMADSNFTHIRIRPNSKIADRKLEKILGNRKRTVSDGASEFQSVRFLTGDRLQPMFRVKKYRQGSTRPSSRTSGSTAVRSLLKNTQNVEGNEGNISKNQMKISNLHEKIAEKQRNLKVLNETDEPLSSKASVLEKIEKKEEDNRNIAAFRIQRLVKTWNTKRILKEKREKEKVAAGKIVSAFKGFLSRKVLKLKNFGIGVIEEESQEDDLMQVINEFESEKNEEKCEEKKEEISQKDVGVEEIDEKEEKIVEDFRKVPENTDEIEKEFNMKEAGIDEEKEKTPEKEEVMKIYEDLSNTLEVHEPIVEESSKLQEIPNEVENAKILFAENETQEENPDKTPIAFQNTDEPPIKPSNSSLELKSILPVQENPHPKDNSPDHYKKCIIFLQSLIRQKQAKKNYLKARNSITKIQATVRMWEVRKIYKSILEAIVFIQRFYRNYKSL